VLIKRKGGFVEHILTHPDVINVVDRYLQKCKDIGFDVIELSSGFLSLPGDDWLRLVDKVHSYKLKAKPELGIQFGAGGGLLFPLWRLISPFMPKCRLTLI